MAERDTFEVFDTRLIDHNLRCGNISPKDYEQHLKKLPDSTTHADYIDVFMETPTSPQSAPQLTFVAVES